MLFSWYSIIPLKYFNKLITIINGFNKFHGDLVTNQCILMVCACNNECFTVVNAINSIKFIHSQKRIRLEQIKNGIFHQKGADEQLI